MADDQLLSVQALARLWGTGVTAVVDSISSGKLLSLDRGLLVAEGRYDIPLIRRSWAEALQEDSSGASRRLEPPEGGDAHPAWHVALDFHTALAEQDAEGVFAASSEESRAAHSPEELLQEWRAIGSHLLRDDAGVGTAIYSLAPFDAVAARIFADAPAVPRALVKATPATLIDVLPMVSEPGGWRVDLRLFEQRQEFYELLASPLPESGALDDSSEPSS